MEFSAAAHSESQQGSIPLWRLQEETLASKVAAVVNSSDPAPGFINCSTVQLVSSISDQLSGAEAEKHHAVELLYWLV